MSKRDPKLLIEDIIGSAQKILSYSSGLTFDDFIQDEKTIDAVVRNFEIIGEASNHLPDFFKSNYPDIDWKRIKGLRNRIVHDYFGIDYSIVWKIRMEYLPDLIQKLQQLHREM